MGTGRSVSCVSAGLAAACFSLFAQAHHSTLGVYDRGNIIEIEGTITNVMWRNPHPSYDVDVTGSDGSTVQWRVETGAISTLRLRGLEESFIEVGDWVRLAGESSTRGLPELYARNMLLADGREVLISATSRPRWTQGDPSRLFQAEFDQSRVEQARREADGIFRVWTSVFGDPNSFPMYSAGDYPLTERGAALKAAWVPRESPYIQCGRKGMVYVMQTPYPIEFEPQGEDIAIRFEEFGALRTIHMYETQIPESAPYTRQGYSIGRWEEESLVVETERIDFPHFYGDGTPQSRSLRTIERFRVSDDETRLAYEIRVEDPDMFPEPMEFSKYWAWKPEIDLEPFECEL